MRETDRNLTDMRGVGRNTLTERGRNGLCNGAHGYY